MVDVFIICIFKLGYCQMAQRNYKLVDFIEPNDIQWLVTNLYKPKPEFFAMTAVIWHCGAEMNRFPWDYSTLNHQKRVMGSITVAVYPTAAAYKSVYQKLLKCFNNIYFNAIIFVIPGTVNVWQFWNPEIKIHWMQWKCPWPFRLKSPLWKVQKLSDICPAIKHFIELLVYRKDML